MKNKKLVVGFMIVFSVLLSSFAFYIWQIIFTPNILLESPVEKAFAIPKGTTFKEIQNKLYNEHYVNDLLSFSFLAKLKKYDLSIKPGMYLLQPNMTNLQAINLLRSGAQTPITLTFNNARKLIDLAEKISRYMEFDSTQMADALNDTLLMANYGFEFHNYISMFIPNTYEVYWTETPKQIIERMHNEYVQFWNEERLSKANAIGLSPKEVSILASIVQGEISMNEESRKVAGLYINRLKRGIPLQADPTLIFAADDFTIRRVLNKHKELDSPYNTYLYPGLPPGPINMPNLITLNSVLDYEKHNYIYMCAKADFSGYHEFSSNLKTHNINAMKFQQALNNQKIFR